MGVREAGGVTCQCSLQCYLLPLRTSGAGPGLLRARPRRPRRALRGGRCAAGGAWAAGCAGSGSLNPGNTGRAWGGAVQGPGGALVRGGVEGTTGRGTQCSGMVDKVVFGWTRCCQRSFPT